MSKYLLFWAICCFFLWMSGVFSLPAPEAGPEPHFGRGRLKHRNFGHHRRNLRKHHNSKEKHAHHRRNHHSNEENVSSHEKFTTTLASSTIANSAKLDYGINLNYDDRYYNYDELAGIAHLPTDVTVVVTYGDPDDAEYDYEYNY